MTDNYLGSEAFTFDISALPKPSHSRHRLMSDYHEVTNQLSALNHAYQAKVAKGDDASDLQQKMEKMFQEWTDKINDTKTLLIVPESPSGKIPIEGRTSPSEGRKSRRSTGRVPVRRSSSGISSEGSLDSLGQQLENLVHNCEPKRQLSGGASGY
ncbi:hypothetical protein H0H87_009486 [Tephrocybe sp. NHM501043]|nr:hypothetical protein H0H87_009486 [Tephrocybe sp. NHM501043]